MKKIGWGIIGLGGIAHGFTQDLLHCKNVKLAAVASKSLDKAKDFANKYGYEKSYGSYEELLEDENVDIVYVATPISFHKEQSIMCMNARKAVLCEKAVARNGNEIREMLECAKRNNVFFIEGLWSRHFPVNRQVSQLLKSGDMGRVNLIKASFGFGKRIEGKIPEPQRSGRLFNIDLAGGSVLDVGVYSLSFAMFMMNKGKPSEIRALSHNVETGVDGMCTFIVKYFDGSMMMLDCATIQTTTHDGLIYCDNGMVKVPEFWHPSKAYVDFTDEDKNQLVFEDDYTKDGVRGFSYEGQHITDCLLEGKLESPYMTWQDSIEVMDVMDEVRKQIGVVYPGE